MIVHPERDPPQITGLQLREPDIDQWNRVFIGDLGDELGLAHTGWSPQHHRCVQVIFQRLKFRIQHVLYTRWSHWDNREKLELEVYTSAKSPLPVID